MTTAIHTDHDIKTAVEDEIAWTPDVDADGIGVAVEDGTVSLSGEVDSYAERLAVTRAALRVRGVSVIADELTVHPDARFSVSDTDIAKEVERALEWNISVPETVKATVKNHHVTLSGNVNWNFQRHVAKSAVEHLRGVTWVTDDIMLNPRPSAADAEKRIKGAFRRNAQLDADMVDASVSGTTVTLTGTVRSWAEKRQAGFAAWSSPHVTDVRNNIVVRAF